MERTSYVTIAKGRGFVYANDNQLFRQVKKRGSVIPEMLHRSARRLSEDRKWRTKTDCKY